MGWRDDMTLLTCHVISIVMQTWAMLSWTWWTARQLTNCGRHSMAFQIGPCPLQKFAKWVGVALIKVSKPTSSAIETAQWCIRVCLMSTSLWFSRTVSESHSQGLPRGSKHPFRWHGQYRSVMIYVDVCVDPCVMWIDFYHLCPRSMWHPDIVWHGASSYPLDSTCHDNPWIHGSPHWCMSQVQVQRCTETSWLMSPRKSVPHLGLDLQWGLCDHDGSWSNLTAVEHHFFQCDRTLGSSFTKAEKVALVAFSCWFLKMLAHASILGHRSFSYYNDEEVCTYSN